MVNGLGKVVDATNLNGDLSVSYDSSGVKKANPRATAAAAGVADETVSVCAGASLPERPPALR